MSRALVVFIDGTQAGILSRLISGRLRFSYEESYRSRPDADEALGALGRHLPARLTDQVASRADRCAALMWSAPADDESRRGR